MASVNTTDRLEVSPLKKALSFSEPIGGASKPIEFLVKFSFDVFMVFVVYIFYTLHSAYYDIQEFYVGESQTNNGRAQWRKMFKAIGYYILDLFLPVSIILLTKTVVIGIFVPSQRDIYFEWQLQCYVFFISCMSLHCYLQTFIMKANEQFTFKLNYLMNPDRLYSLGLGRIKGNIIHVKGHVAEFIQNLKSVKSQQDIHKSSTLGSVDNKEIFNEAIILPITVALNIEPFFMHFRYINDEEIMEQDLKSAINQSVGIKQEIKLQGTDSKGFKYIFISIVKNLFHNESLIKGNKLSDDLLFPLYEKADKTFQEESPQRLLAIVCYLILKVGIPFFYVILNHTTALKLGSLLVILGFFIYIVSFIFLISDNEDLKRRTFINHQLAKYISFNNNDKNNDKFDITCVVSLHCWNDARRISLVMDKDKTEKYEVSYIFLGVYLIFLLIVLAQIFLDIHWFVGKTSFFRSPLILMNMSIDCFLLTSIFINRIYHGDKFNNSFINQKDAVQDLLEAVTSLQNMRSFFFDKVFCTQLQNQYFRRIVGKVEQKIYFKQMSQPITDKEFDQRRKEFISLLVVQVALMKKQCLYDIDVQKHRFLGLFVSDFTALMQTLFIAFLSVAPTLMGSIAANL